MGRLLRLDERAEGFLPQPEPCLSAQIRGYWISHARIHSKARQDLYAEAMLDLIDRLGARIIVRSDLPAQTEDGVIQRVGIVEFDNHFDAVRAWNDKEVQQTLRLFDDTCTFTTQIVAGTGE
jgi:uncharacterized protein (DUF1330 family)